MKLFDAGKIISSSLGHGPWPCRFRRSFYGRVTGFRSFWFLSRLPWHGDRHRHCDERGGDVVVFSVAAIAAALRDASSPLLLPLRASSSLVCRWCRGRLSGYLASPFP